MTWFCGLGQHSALAGTCQPLSGSIHFPRYGREHSCSTMKRGSPLLGRELENRPYPIQPRPVAVRAKTWPATRRPTRLCVRIPYNQALAKHRLVVAGPQSPPTASACTSRREPTSRPGSPPKGGGLGARPRRGNPNGGPGRQRRGGRRGHGEALLPLVIVVTDHAERLQVAPEPAS